MSASLPPRPSLEWLRKSAKDRLDALRIAQPDAQLADAQLAVARDYGFRSWRALKAHVDEVLLAAHPPIDEEAVAAFLRRVGAGRLDDVRASLASEPQLVNAVGRHPYWGGRPQALHVAIETRRPEMFDLLLERGADIDGANDQYGGWSPLMLSVQRRQDGMRDELLRRGAHVGLVEALMLADDDRVRGLLEGGRLPEDVPNHGSLLAFARTPYAIDRLIALGVPIDSADQWGARPIDAMSRLGAAGAALVRHLEAHGARVSAADLARLGDLAGLSARVDADPAVARDEAVMMAAVDGGHHALVEWLLTRGAPVHARAEAPSRRTALHAAAWNGDRRMVEILVAAGADLHARDAEYDAPPLGWAQTAIEVTNNPRCADVAAYLSELTRGG
jgi:ankyrin repeat protein